MALTPGRRRRWRRRRVWRGGGFCGTLQHRDVDLGGADTTSNRSGKNL